MRRLAGSSQARDTLERLIGLDNARLIKRAFSFQNGGTRAILRARIRYISRGPSTDSGLPEASRPGGLPLEQRWPDGLGGLATV